MTCTLRIATLALASATLLAADAAAQRRGLVDVTPPHHRRGFWVEGGLGWGQESYKFASDPYSSSLGKPTFDLQVGGTVNPYLRLGGEWNVWWYDYQNDDGYDVTESLHYVGAVARVYPVTSLGLFAKGGAGLGISSASVDYGDGTSETGFAWNAGVGYEIKVSRTLYITPQAGWYFSSYQKRDDDTLYERLFNLTLNVTFQPGR